MSHVRVRERIGVREVDASAVRELAAALSVPEVVARVLVGRDLKTYEACERFYNPRLEDLHNPHLFPGMERAVSRLSSAVGRGEKIVVYGDYDVDGVTATAMMVRLLRRLGGDCDYYLPNRLTEGYGITADAIRTIAERGAKVIVSVDCGIAAREETALAASLGVDMVVTDHHEPHGSPPDAVAVLDPKLPGCGYPETSLAGVGVAMKLAQALSGAIGSEPELWQEYLDLVALGTAADIVPMTGENRILVAHGLHRIAQTENMGLQALIREQGLEGKRLGTHHLVFQLAPAINAVGRLGDSRSAVEMLLATDEGVAEGYARELVQTNRERRALNEQVEEEAVAWVHENCDLEHDMAFVIGNEDWHQGVVGIVASKLVERYYRPAILFAIVDGVAHGSGRTIPSLHLLDALKGCEDLLDSYGGHSSAVGLRLPASRLEQLRERFNAIVRERLTPEDLTPTVVVDAEATLNDLSPKVFRIIERMRPFGPGNMRPVLLTRGLRHARTPRIVGRNHLKLSINGANGIMDAIGFGFGDRIEELPYSNRFGLAFCLDENEWNGRKALQMLIKGVTR